MSVDPLAGCASAAFQALEVDAGLTDQLATPESIFDTTAPDGAAKPYLTIGRSDEALAVAPQACGTEVMLSVDVWHERTKSQDAKKIANAVRNLLDHAMPVAGLEVHDGHWVSTKLRGEPDALTASLVVTFRYLITPAA